MSLASSLESLSTDLLSEIATFLPISSLTSFLSTSSHLSASMFEDTWKCCAEAAYGSDHLAIIQAAMLYQPPAATWKDRLKKRVLLSKYPTPSLVERCDDTNCCHEYALILDTTLPKCHVFPPIVLPWTFVVMMRSIAIADEQPKVLYHSQLVSLSTLCVDLFKPGTECYKSAMAEIEKNLEANSKAAPDGVSAKDILTSASNLYESVLEGAGPTPCDDENCDELHLPLDSMMGRLAKFVPSQLTITGDFALTRMQVFALDRRTGMMALLDSDCEVERAPPRENAWRSDDPSYMFSAAIEMPGLVNASFLGSGYTAFALVNGTAVVNHLHFEVELTAEAADNAEEINDDAMRKFFDDLFD
jgi:hypothetical protein